MDVRWRRAEDDYLPRVVLVLDSAEVVSLAAAGALQSELARVQAAEALRVAGSALTLVVCGRSVAGLEQRVMSAQLELGVSSRRVLNDKELAELLASYTAVLASASGSGGGGGGRSGIGGVTSRESLGGSAGEGFLAGLTAQDVLHNKGVPRSLKESWLGALKQLLPEAAASAVAAEYPSFRRLYAYMQRAERDHARRARGGGGGGAAVDLGALENVRVGAKRFGPARSRRLYRVIMATREQAAEPVQ